MCKDPQVTMEIVMTTLETNWPVKSFYWWSWPGSSTHRGRGVILPLDFGRNGDGRIFKCWGEEVQKSPGTYSGCQGISFVDCECGAAVVRSLFFMFYDLDMSVTFKLRWYHFRRSWSGLCFERHDYFPFSKHLNCWSGASHAGKPDVTETTGLGPRTHELQDKKNE